MFAIHKLTGIKYFFPNGDASLKIPVRDLPSHPQHSAVAVVCDQCQQRFTASLMLPSQDGPGLTCAACTRQHAPQAQEPADTHEAALRKAKSLLRLARSDNPAEAAAAMAKAQEFIDRHRLSIAASQLDEAAPVESDEPIQDFSHDPIFPGTQTLDRWKGMIALRIAKQNQCFAYSNGGQIILVGRPSDVQTARYFITYLTQEIERLANKHCRGTSRTYWNNFRIGAAETVCERLKQQRGETLAKMREEAAMIGARANALVLVNQSLALIEQRTQAAEDFARAGTELKKRTGSGGRYNSAAREAGRRAGHSIALGRPSHQLK